MSSSFIRKLDMALGDLASGGLLVNEQADTFIRTLIDQPTLLRQVRTVPMERPTMEINKVIFGSRILKASTQAGGFNDNGNPPNDRYLTEADRSKPTTSKVTLSTKEVIAEVHLPYELLEDNIEKGNFEATVLALIAERAALDLEELMILGDTASGDAYLAQMSGLLKLSTSHVLDAAGASVNPSIFSNAQKLMPTKYRRNLGQMRYFSSMNVETDWRLSVSSRQTGLGDGALTGSNSVSALGVPLAPAALMPNAQMSFCDPKNVIFGVQRNIRIETDRDIRSRQLIFVLTARVAIQIEEEDAVVKVINLG